MHQAIPCGLIINELLSNAPKYAYPRGHSGEINIQFALLESGKLSLSCQDKGKGIPETFDWKNSSSLGLRMIRILTKHYNSIYAVRLAKDQTNELFRRGGWETGITEPPSEPARFLSAGTIARPKSLFLGARTLAQKIPMIFPAAPPRNEHARIRSAIDAAGSPEDLQCRAYQAIEPSMAAWTNRAPIAQPHVSAPGESP
jgi:hypothetical protein